MSLLTQLYVWHELLACIDIHILMLQCDQERVLWGENSYSQHPCSILHLVRISFDIPVIKGASIMHVNIVVIFKMLNQEHDITSNRAFSSGIRAIIWAISERIILTWSDIIIANYNNWKLAITRICQAKINQAVPATLFMPEPAVVGEYTFTAQKLVLAWQF